jgi:hypothetical protein
MLSEIKYYSFTNRARTEQLLILSFAQSASKAKSAKITYTDWSKNHTSAISEYEVSSNSEDNFIYDQMESENGSDLNSILDVIESIPNQRKVVSLLENLYIAGIARRIILGIKSKNTDVAFGHLLYAQDIELRQ